MILIVVINECDTERHNMNHYLDLISYSTTYKNF